MHDGDGIPWLTTRERDLLAYLTVHTISPQLDHEHDDDELADALGELADVGEVLLRADDENVWVLVCGRVIVHATRDWLRWAATVNTN